MYIVISIILITLIIIADIYQLIFYKTYKICTVTNFGLFLSSLNCLMCLGMEHYGECLLWLIPVCIECFILGKTYQRNKQL